MNVFKDNRKPWKGLGCFNDQKMILEGSSKFLIVKWVALEMSMVSRGPRKDVGSINGQQRILKGFMKF